MFIIRLFVLVELLKCFFLMEFDFDIDSLFVKICVFVDINFVGIVDLFKVIVKSIINLFDEFV